MWGKVKNNRFSKWVLRNPFFSLVLMLLIIVAFYIFALGIEPAIAVAMELAEKRLLSPIVFGVAALLSVCGLVATLHSNRKTVKDRETINYIFGRLTNENFVSSLKCIIKMHDEGEAVRTYANRTKESDPKAIAIKTVLNHYEALAIAVKADIYNEQMIIDWSIGGTVKTYEVLEKYIESVRKEYSHYTYYDQFEELAERWKLINKKRRNSANKLHGVASN